MTDLELSKLERLDNEKLLAIAKASRAYLEIAGPPRTAAGFLVDPEKYGEARNNLCRALGEKE